METPTVVWRGSDPIFVRAIGALVRRHLDADVATITVARVGHGILIFSLQDGVTDW